MRKLIFILLLLPSYCFGQSTLPFSTIGVQNDDTAYTPNTLRFPKYANTDTNKVLSVNERGIVEFRTKGTGGGSGIQWTDTAYYNTMTTRYQSDSNYVSQGAFDAANNSVRLKNKAGENIDIVYLTGFADSLGLDTAKTAIRAEIAAGGGTLQGVTTAGNETDNEIIINRPVGSLITFPTINGDTATVYPAGNFHHTIDNSYVNSDGQIDAVYQWGYNQNGAGGKVNPNEAEIHFAIESHYIGGGTSTTGDFEVHLESHDKAGNTHRHFSVNIVKDNGSAKAFWEVAQMNWWGNNLVGVGDPFFALMENAQATLTGSAAALRITSSAAADAGSVAIVPNLDGSTTFTNSSTNTAKSFGFDSPVAFSASNNLAGTGTTFDFNSTVSATQGIVSLRKNSVLIYAFTGDNTTGAYNEFNLYNNSASNIVTLGTGGTATGDVFQNSAYLLSRTAADKMIIASQNGGIEFYTVGLSTTSVYLKENGNINLNVSEYASEADAISAGLTAGDIYRTGNDLHIVD